MVSALARRVGVASPAAAVSPNRQMRYTRRPLHHRMKRRLLNFLTALSLAQSVAVVALWVRSTFVTDVFLRWTFQDEGERTIWYQRCTVIGRGGVGFCQVSQRGRPDSFRDEVARLTERPFPWHTATRPPKYPDFRVAGRRRGWGGFHYASMDANASLAAFEIVAPVWSVLPPLALLPALRAGRWWRLQKTARPGHCRRCDYDLRATPGRCPECGTEPPREDIQCERQDAKNAKIGREESATDGAPIRTDEDGSAFHR
jgi:hypothetical protein